MGAGASAALALGACDADALRSADLDTSSPLEDGPDPALIAEARAAISTAAGVVQAQRRAFPRLRSELRDWERLHAQHARALGDPLTPARSVAADDLASARAEVVAAHARLGRRLTRASIGADDGDLALLLGSMVAAIAQRGASR